VDKQEFLISDLFKQKLDFIEAEGLESDTPLKEIENELD
jgi:hypothetical protein